MKKRVINGSIIAVWIAVVLAAFYFAATLQIKPDSTSAEFKHHHDYRKK